jgi:hypothetical protein
MESTKPGISVVVRRAVLATSIVIAAVVIATTLVRTQEQTQQERPVWDVQLAANTHASSNITIRNLCKKTHSFTVVEQQTPYLSLLAGASVSVHGNSSYNLPVRFSTDGMNAGQYQGSVLVKCENCRKEKGCQQDREVIPLRLEVLAAGAKPNNPTQPQVPGAPSMPDKKAPTGPIAGGPAGPVSQPTPTPAPTPTATVKGEFCKETEYKGNYNAANFGGRVDSSNPKRLKVRFDSTGPSGKVLIFYHCVDPTNKTHSTTFTVQKSSLPNDIIQVDCEP